MSNDRRMAEEEQVERDDDCVLTDQSYHPSVCCRSLSAQNMTDTGKPAKQKVTQKPSEGTHKRNCTVPTERAAARCHEVMLVHSPVGAAQLHAGRPGPDTVAPLWRFQLET